MARPLVLDDPAREKLSKLRAHAEANPLSTRDMLRAVQRKRPPIGDCPDFVVNLPFGWRIVFSIEDHGKAVVRHLSVSVNDEPSRPPTKAPNLTAVALIARELGFAIEDDLSLTNTLVSPDVELGLRAPNIYQRVTDAG